MAPRSRALAAGLADRGVGRGDVVGLLSYNCPEFLETVFAANYLGAVAMPINWRLAAPEVRYILEHSRARALVCDEALVGLAPVPRTVWSRTVPGLHRPTPRKDGRGSTNSTAGGTASRGSRWPPTTSTGSCTRRAPPVAPRAS